MLKAFVAVQTRLNALRRDEDGAALIEYSLLIGLVAVGIVAAIAAVTVKVTGNWTSLKTAIGA